MQPARPAATAASGHVEPVGMAYLIDILEIYRESTRAQLYAGFHNMFEAQDKLLGLCMLIEMQVIHVNGAPYAKPPIKLGTPQAQLLVQKLLLLPFKPMSIQGISSHCSS